MVECKPMPIKGNWEQGYVLDYHTLRSEIVGHDEFGHPRFHTTRSEIGELLYRLKYSTDRLAMKDLVEVASTFIAGRKHVLDLIVPVPPTRRREFQPVIEIVKGISEILQVAWCEDCFIKIKDTPELKNVDDYQQRLKLLEDAYTCDATRLSGKSILVFDDLYRSGATLKTLVEIAYRQGNAAHVFVLALTRTRKGAIIVPKIRKEL